MVYYNIYKPTDAGENHYLPGGGIKSFLSYDSFGLRNHSKCKRLDFICSSLNSMLLLQTRNNFVSTKQEVEKLMKRIRSADQDYKPPGQWTMEGFLYVQEKRESS